MARQFAEWCLRHERHLLLAFVAVAVVLRGFLVATSPPHGYIWDLYRDGVRVLANEGRLPVAADCWQCYHPPLFYVVGWPFHQIGFGLGGVEWADRVLSSLSLVSVGILTWYGYRLLKLFGASGVTVVGGVAVLLASPLLFITSYGADADVLLAAILAAFTFYLAKAVRKPAGFGSRTVVTLGVLAGLAMATKYSGLAALATAGVVIGLRLVVRSDRLAVARQGLAILTIAVVIGGWKYVDNYRVYGTAFQANGTAAEGLSLGARKNRGGYEFTTFRLTELMALFGPRPPQGELTYFPVYKSVLTSLHAQAWSDMSFFSVASRHGDPGTRYPRKVAPVRLVRLVILLGFVPELLAIVGLVVTIRDQRYWPLAALTVVTLGAYVSWFLPQDSWALKTKYIAVLVPVFVVYAMEGARWLGSRVPAAGWLVGAAMATLVGASFLYQYAFANGHL